MQTEQNNAQQTPRAAADFETTGAKRGRRGRRNGRKRRAAVVRSIDQHGKTAKHHVTSNAHARYSAEEKAWLKAHYGNEFRFLRAYGLQITDKEDRQEGERIVRALMDQDSIRSDDESPIRGDEHAYSQGEHKWLHNGFGGEQEFLERHALNINNADDRAEGRRLVRAMMDDDGSAENPWMLDMERSERELVMNAVIHGITPY